jgi:predicted nucleotidyltransferase
MLQSPGTVDRPSTLSPLEQQALSCFARAVRARFGTRVVDIRLFGSRARGEGRDDSDLDVFIELTAASREDKLAIYDLGFDVGFEHHLTFSPLVAAAGQWRDDLPIARAVAQDGVPL